jgi:hypothetical protein
MFDELTDEKAVRRRIISQGRHLLESIIDAYEAGALDDPKQAAGLCTLFALCAEGKVYAFFDEETSSTKWSITDNWAKHLREVEDSILSSKIIKGPWKNSVDKDVNT